VQWDANERRLAWVLPLTVIVGSSLVLLSLMVCSPYGDLLGILIIAPIVCLVCLLLMVTSAIRRRPLQCLSALLTLAAVVAVSGVLHAKKDAVRASIRWLLWSRHYKAEVLVQPTPGSGELRHIEWEATGFAGVANNTVYLVFDPTDSLSPAARSHSPGKYSGIPCEVVFVRRLESHWYSVLFYTDEMWGNCTGSGQ
jgi:hypothetical protein